VDLPAIQPDALQVFLFGPGTGELVAVRAPPGEWLIVDGCGVGKRSYAPLLLQHYGDRPSIVLFTHPHSDHYRGLQEVIDDATEDSSLDWPILGMVAPPEADARTASLVQYVSYLAQGSAEQVVSAIRDRWERRPSCKWTLQPGTTKPLGAAIVRAISPTVLMRNVAQKAFEEGRNFDDNRISAAVELEWAGHRLILGSDLVELPGRGWTSALGDRTDLPKHRAMKIAHHGSVGALHPDLLARPFGTEPPEWLVAPFASKDLPKFSLGGGLDQLLAHVPFVNLTALPRPHAAQSARHHEIAIETLRPDGRHLAFDPVTSGFPDCYVLVELAASGSTRVIRGPGSVRVVR
jgi:hypothetical protein